MSLVMSLPLISLLSLLVFTGETASMVSKRDVIQDIMTEGETASMVSKRDVIQDIRRAISPDTTYSVGGSSCSAVVGEAVTDCRAETKFLEKGSQTNNVDSKCCRFSHFKRCIKNSVIPSCGTATDGVVDQVLSNTYTDWMRECGQYDYYAPVCLYYLWYTWFTLFTVIALILSCCCFICCVRCFCCC